MNTVVLIVPALVVTCTVTYVIPKGPVKLLSQAKESTITFAQKSVVHLQESSNKEGKLLAGSMQDPHLQLAHNSTSGLQRGFVHDSVHKRIRETSKNASLILSDTLVPEEKPTGKRKFVRDGQHRSHLANPNYNGMFSILVKHFSFIDKFSRASHNKNIKEPTKLPQRANLQHSLSNIKDESRFKIPAVERTHSSDSAHQYFKILSKEFNFTLHHSSIVAPAQIYPTKPGKTSIVAEINYNNPEDVPLHDILAQQAIEALVLESSAVMKLDSITFLALECLLPPIDVRKTSPDIIKPSKPWLTLGLIEESDDDPVKTILNLWDSDEDGERNSENSYYDDEINTEEDDGSDYIEFTTFEPLRIN